MSAQAFVNVQDSDGNVYKLSPAEAAAARASGIYKTPDGKDIPFHREPSLPIAEFGKVIVYSKATGKAFQLFPVDAAEALSSGEFSKEPVSLEAPKTPAPEEKAPEGGEGVGAGIPTAGAPEAPAGEGGKPWKDADGNLIALTEEAKREVLVEALKSESVQFRGNASNADLLAQWNAFVAEKAAE